MLEVSLHDDIKEIRLARAPVNALNDALIGALLEQFAPEALATARAVVLSGQRGVFTAGLDLRALTEPGAIDYRAFARRFFTLQQRIASSPV
ncbi:MAG: enoyl-CoA hydratase-related protein, partial [Gammaproteobacteria bacterium]|nr:enoyl-CoA hydratase-related protein [Gammaproteobacteria bacterium]